jgi:hypothetical protein
MCYDMNAAAPAAFLCYLDLKDGWRLFIVLYILNSSSEHELFQNADSDRQT